MNLRRSVPLVFALAAASTSMVTSAPSAFACTCVGTTRQPLAKAASVYIASPIDAEVERIDASIPADGRERVVLVPFTVQRVLKGSPISIVSNRHSRHTVEQAEQELGPGEPVAALPASVADDQSDGLPIAIVALVVAVGVLGGFTLGRRRIQG